MERSTTFDAWVREKIQAKGISARQLAAYAGVSPNSVSQWIRGTKPKPENLFKLATALGEDYQYLLRLADILPMDAKADEGGAVITVKPANAGALKQLDAILERDDLDTVLAFVQRLFSRRRHQEEVADDEPEQHAD